VAGGFPEPAMAMVGAAQAVRMRSPEADPRRVAYRIAAGGSSRWMAEAPRSALHRQEGACPGSPAGRTYPGARRVHPLLRVSSR
jgi:hypothetical protein